MNGQYSAQTCSCRSLRLHSHGLSTSPAAAAHRNALPWSRRHVCAPRRRHSCKAVAAEQSEAACPGSIAICAGNPIVRAGVSGLTALLEALGVGRRPQNTQKPARRLDRVQRGDVGAIMECIRSDFEEHAYFVTGDIWEGIYAEDCFFGDPTVSFTGLQKWRKNLQLLVPFLLEPRIDLLYLSELSDVLATGNGSAQRLKADWRLRTYLKLPWKPLIDIGGSTEYTLDPMSQQVVRHIESWSVSGADAILQILKPSHGPGRTSKG